MPAPPVVQASASPAPTPEPTAPEPVSFTATYRGPYVTVTNHTDRPAWVEVAWELQMPDGGWWRYYVEDHMIEAGWSSAYHPDCLYPAPTRIIVLGHGLYDVQTPDLPRPLCF